jgi:hypothetical protein
MEQAYQAQFDVIAVLELLSLSILNTRFSSFMRKVDEIMYFSNKY